MTAPAYPQAQGQQSNTSSPAVDTVIAALAAYFISKAAIRAVTLPASLINMMIAAGIAPKAAKAAGRMALSVPLTGRSRHGAPSVPDDWRGPFTPATPSMARRVAADEPQMRAQYVMNAARRLTERLTEGEFLPALRTERGNLTAHVMAGRNRQAAAQVLDLVAKREGPFLRWVAKMDERTTPDCAVLNHVIFTIDNPPGIPGAMHPRCRCVAVGAQAMNSKPIPAQVAAA